MKLKYAPLALALAMAVPGSAQAQSEPITDLFQQVCLTSDLDTQTIIQQARAHGFVAPPQALLEQYIPAEMADAELLWTAVEGGLKMVVAGAMSFDESSGVMADVCATAIMPRQQDVAGPLRDLLGVGAPLKQDGQQIFTFRDQDGRRIAVDMESPAGLGLMMSGQLRMVTIVEDAQDDMQMIMFMKLRLD